MPEETTEATTQPPIPNFAVTPKTVTVNGVAEERLVVTYGAQVGAPSLPEHTLEIRRVDMGDQFDLAEIAGQQIGNDVWLSLAIVALAVKSVDGVPEARFPLTKTALRKTLVAIGPLGVRAVRDALAGGKAEEDVKAAAGN